MCIIYLKIYFQCTGTQGLYITRTHFSSNAISTIKFYIFTKNYYMKSKWHPVILNKLALIVLTFFFDPFLISSQLLVIRSVVNSSEKSITLHKKMHNTQHVLLWISFNNKHVDFHSQEESLSSYTCIVGTKEWLNHA